MFGEISGIKSLRMFFSYSIDDKKIVGMLKEQLEFFSLDLSSGWETPPGYPKGLEQKILAGRTARRTVSKAISSLYGMTIIGSGMIPWTRTIATGVKSSMSFCPGRLGITGLRRHHCSQ